MNKLLKEMKKRIQEKHEGQEMILVKDDLLENIKSRDDLLKYKWIADTSVEDNRAVICLTVIATLATLAPMVYNGVGNNTAGVGITSYYLVVLLLLIALAVFWIKFLRGHTKLKRQIQIVIEMYEDEILAQIDQSAQ